MTRAVWRQDAHDAHRDQKDRHDLTRIAARDLKDQGSKQADNGRDIGRARSEEVAQQAEHDEQAKRGRRRAEADEILTRDAGKVVEEADVLEAGGHRNQSREPGQHVPGRLVGQEIIPGNDARKDHQDDDKDCGRRGVDAELARADPEHQCQDRDTQHADLMTAHAAELLVFFLRPGRDFR